MEFTMKLQTTSSRSYQCHNKRKQKSKDQTQCHELLVLHHIKITLPRTLIVIRTILTPTLVIILVCASLTTIPIDGHQHCPSLVLVAHIAIVVPTWIVRVLTHLVCRCPIWTLFKWVAVRNFRTYILAWCLNQVSHRSCWWWARDHRLTRLHLLKYIERIWVINCIWNTITIRILVVTKG
jgi:hypothetical protein